MLSAVEEIRVENFSRNFDRKTAEAMRNLFIITKPGENKPASILIEAAHEQSHKLSGANLNYLEPLGLVFSDGSIPHTVKRAIRKAVTQGYLVMKGFADPNPKPSTGIYPSYE